MSGSEKTKRDITDIEAPFESELHSIKIKGVAKRNGLTTFLIGLVALFGAIMLLAFLPHSLYLVGVFALSASIVTMLIGWFKVREPVHSIELTKTHILYHHRHGKWSLEWSNIQRIDVPKVSHGLEQINLGMVGIKIKQYEPLLSSISPRLATNLLLEQRPLLLQNNQCVGGGCYSNTLIENDTFKTPEGKIIKGIPAMLANRMTKLRAGLGFDVFISVGELDRSSEDFVVLLRDCLSSVNSTYPD
ncbi:DUF2982 domain-containing protein [Aliiglaciecola sp. 2_MG-2023]|uniref:DUF2982 domain-containing protein n=1 Tax=unclassified Aliiglaciecola TaxID=2593648 RepID=UPI0026E2E45C|nr:MULTISPECIES: DUF2982 domain-containing protein [unclassified Aliiglaciecola]MDO6709621.1 DUF2982 domain-containing protein [Aliiglaciecola sp. 2_MG-2023]MDO6750837.1 DUF2982 domain-containing protein [Aliiglaciecola sp. 1_MG-2023]